MNQDSNNLNQNKFNTQGNNVLPNNQPLQNNQELNNSLNQNVNVNQATFNSQQQVNTDYQQITNQMNMQQPTPQPMNSFENGNTNQSFNSKSPKKNNLGLIIGIVVSVIIIVIGIVFGSKLFSNNKNSNNSSENNVSENNNNENSNDLNDNDKTNNIDLIYTFMDARKPVAFDYPNLKVIEEGTSRIFKNSKYVIAYSKEEKNSELKDIPMQLSENFKYATSTHLEGEYVSISVEESKEMEVNDTKVLEIKGHIISEYDDGSRLNLPMKGYTFKKDDTIFQLIGFINEESNENNQKEMEDTIDAMIKTLRDDR